MLLITKLNAQKIKYLLFSVKHREFKGTEDLFLNSADIKNINSTQQIKFKELTKRFFIQQLRCQTIQFRFQSQLVTLK